MNWGRGLRKRAFTNTATVFNEYWSQFDRTSWGLTVLPAATSLSLLMSIGPDLQRHVVDLLSSDAPSIYATAYQESLARLPTLGTWLLTGFQWPYLLMALLSIIFALRGSTFAAVIGRLVVATFVAMTVGDLISGAVTGSLELSNILLNVAANLVGAVLLAGLMAIGLTWFELISERLPIFGVGGRVNASIFLIAFGALVSTVTYFAFSFFYQPRSVSVDVTATLPVSGEYLNSTGKGRKDGASAEIDDKRPLSFLPLDIPGGAAEVISPGENMSAQWRQLSPNRKFDAYIELYADCPLNRKTFQLPAAESRIELHDIRALSVRFDEGTSEAEIRESPENNFTFNDKVGGSFWVKEEKDEVEVQFFTGKEGVLSNVSDQTQEIYLNAPLMRSKAGVSRTSARTMHIQADGKKISIPFAKAEKFDPKRKLNCVSLQAPISSAQNVQTQLPFGTLMVGARVRLVPRASFDSLIRHDLSELRIVNSNGWVKFERLPKATFKNRFLGTSGLISLERGVISASVDGVKLDVENDVHIFGIGEFNARYTNDVALRITGTGTAIWKDNQRLNPTKWERLRIELQILVLTALGGILLTIGKFFRPTLNRFRSPEPLLGL